MSRQVRLLPQANVDLRSIAEAIRVRVSVASAKRWGALLRAAIVDLADSAEMYPEADEARLLGRNVRMRIVGKPPHVYRILFTFTADEVSVHRIRHAAQDYLTEDDI